MPDKCCGTCKWGTDFNHRGYGECTWPRPALPDIPHASNVRMLWDSIGSIWTDYGTNCPVWAEREKQP